MSLGSAHVGSRVNVAGRGDGTLAFFGETQFKPGTWCGVWLDQPHVSSRSRAEGTHAQSEEKQTARSNVQALRSSSEEEEGKEDWGIKEVEGKA